MPDNSPTEKYVVLYSETYVKELKKRAEVMARMLVDAETLTKQERAAIYLDFNKWMDK